MRVLVLGAGFGGLELASCLSEELGDAISVTLIDQSDSFVFGYSKLDVLFGKVNPETIRIPYNAIRKPGVQFRQETIRSIDPVNKRVQTDQGTHAGDVLVVALGANYDLAATPGLAESGSEFYSVQGATHLREVLPTFAGGTAVIAVATPHYKCPPAPSEAAFLLDDYLRERGIREKSRIIVISPMPTPLPISPEVGAAILTEFGAHGIEFMGRQVITRIDAEGHAIHLESGQVVEADLILAIPVHVVPQVVVESGMTENGWIPTDKYTLETRYPDVFAFGDVASVGVPRAGVFSEGQARIVAAHIIARHRAAQETGRYQGTGACYLEFGGDRIGRVDVNFLGGPSATAHLVEPSIGLRAEKTAFGATRRARWFGLP